MKRVMISLITLAIVATVPAAQAQGPIGTVERGRYVCEMPGNAGGVAGVAQPDEDFTIRSASRYSSPQGGGTYLRRGDTLTMTSGPRNGDRYHIRSSGFLRKIENGEPGRLRCIRHAD